MEEDDDDDNVYASFILEDSETSFTPTHSLSESDSQSFTPPLNQLTELLQVDEESDDQGGDKGAEEDAKDVRALEEGVRDEVSSMISEFVDSCLTQLGLRVLQVR